MGKLTKNQIKRIALLHSATLLDNAEVTMFEEDSVVSPEEQDLILNQIYLIASKLSKGMPLGLGSTKNIVDFVKTNFK